MREMWKRHRRLTFMGGHTFAHLLPQLANLEVVVGTLGPIVFPGKDLDEHHPAIAKQPPKHLKRQVLDEVQRLK